MEERLYKNHIRLGQESKKTVIFKVFDALCVDNGPSNSVFGKSVMKTLTHDPIDYLKIHYKVETDNIPIISTENCGKIPKRILKRKLHPIRNKMMGSKTKLIRYLLPLLDSKTNKVQGQEVFTWFSEKLIAKNVLTNKVAFAVESLAVFVNSIFYKSHAELNFDSKAITFELYLKERLVVELSQKHVVTITVYSKYPFIKVAIRSIIAEELLGLYTKYGLKSSDVFKCAPKKAYGIKDVLLLFTNRQLSYKEFEHLSVLYGSEKVQWNESETESKEILENVLHDNPHLSELTVNKGRLNWSIIFMPKPKDNTLNVHLNPSKRLKSPLTPNSNIAQQCPLVPHGNAPTTPQKLPIAKPLKTHQPNPIGPQTKVQQPKRPPPNPITPHRKGTKQNSVSQHTNTPPNAQTQPNPMVTATNIAQPNLLASHALMTQPNLLFAQQSNLFATHQNMQLPNLLASHQNMQQANLLATHHNMQQTMPNIPPQGPLVVTNPNMMQQSQTLMNYQNYIVTCPATSTPNKFDAMPNIFNRMRNDSQANMSNGSIHLSVNPVASLNQFIGNGTRPSQQVINVPVMVNVDNAMPKPAPSNHLVYLPNRNMSNVFETFHYNPSPDSDVLIHGSDLLCLNFGQYLNDNIINFYLNYIRYEIMSEDQRQRTHLFNVFFNTKLQGSVANMATDTPEMKHARVAKWTKKVDIFDKDFIIIPINENQHWFLAIVCFPWMAGMISYDMLLGLNNNQTPSEIPVNNTLFATKYRVERLRRLREECGVDPSPCILLFDSLQYQSRAPNVKLIRDYLKTEWDSKRRLTDGPLVFDKNTVRGFNPQVPQQTNTIDCGIFVLHYVEQFFSNPLKVFTKEYFQSSLLQWFETETVAKKRASIQKMVLDKADEYMANNATHNSSDQSSTANTALDESGPDLQML